LVHLLNLNHATRKPALFRSTVAGVRGAHGVPAASLAVAGHKPKPARAPIPLQQTEELPVSVQLLSRKHVTRKPVSFR
jgi:hypothetical protein